MTTIQQSTDHELKTAIIAEMAWMPNVEADQIGVALTDGAVTLSGQVATYTEKTAAVQAALRVRGVTAVVDEITAHHISGEHDDADIAREAGRALDSSINVLSGSINATVHDHVITLTGTTPWQYQRDAARRAVAGLAGVTEVDNKITLKPLLEVSPSQARKNIAAAFVRNATLDAENVTVDVRESEIRLTGSVSCWADRHQAEYAAWSTPGVTHVDNRVHVTP